ncbi:MAG: hypothetical protein R6X12_07745 [bacterium]
MRRGARLRILFVALAGLVGLAQAEPNPPPLLDFDSTVTAARLELRSYCALVQKLDSASTAEAVNVTLDHLGRAQAVWREVVARYGTNPPAEYLSDAGFAARLADVETAMGQMESLLRAGDYAGSFKACGKGCAEFIRMHEENRLAYASDRLYHLRRATKDAIATAKDSAGPGRADSLVARVLELRNRALLGPCPYPGDTDRCQCYRRKVSDMSAAVDRFVLARHHRDAAFAATGDALMDAVNRAYSAALRCTNKE